MTTTRTGVSSEAGHEDIIVREMAILRARHRREAEMDRHLLPEDPADDDHWARVIRICGRYEQRMLDVWGRPPRTREQYDAVRELAWRCSEECRAIDLPA